MVLSHAERVVELVAGHRHEAAFQAAELRLALELRVEARRLLAHRRVQVGDLETGSRRARKLQGLPSVQPRAWPRRAATGPISAREQGGYEGRGGRAGER